LSLAAGDLLRARRVLCIQPHYDDNDLGAGGTIAALADAGAEVSYLTVTDDLAGVLDPALSDSEATARLRAEQAEAGAVIGVAAGHWLGLPDAGPYDYHDLRRGILRLIRKLRPELLFTVDPWLPDEAHSDHLLVGRAVAEAALLQGLPRLRVDPEVDRGYVPYQIAGVVFYFTTRPNLCFDVTGTRERKHRAIDAYRSQLAPATLAALHAGLEAKEREWAAQERFSHGEVLRAVRPSRLHVNLDARA
jgi:LmbE family N-acetylglucosaminyl deacetylase